MGSLATKLSKVEVATVAKLPSSPCFPLYGWGDEEDLEQVNRLRRDGAEWVQVQSIVDEAADVQQPIPVGKFIRHWRGQCSCWKHYQGENR